MNISGWFVNNVFFFVTPYLLKLFALSILVLDLCAFFHPRHVVVQWVMAIWYGVYCALRIAPISNLVQNFNWGDFFAVLPFFLVLFLPLLLKKIPIIDWLLTNDTMHLYFLVFTVAWLRFAPQDGDVLIVLIYTCTVFFLMRLGGYFAQPTAYPTELSPSDVVK
jgi:hypothetical protein